MRVKNQIIIAIAGIFAVVAAGSAGFSMLEGISLFDALWLTIITVLTVGYGDLVPQTTNGKIFAMVLIPLGISIVTYAFGVIAAVVLDGTISGSFRRRQMNKQIGKLHGHIIICGLGRVGNQVLQQLRNENKDVVVVDLNVEPKMNLLQNSLYVVGSATEDEVLYQAGIERAKGIISTLPKDAENVFVTLTAKGINPKLKVVARAERPESEGKLRRAGADQVINPSSIGGRRMAMSILKPNIIDYVEIVLHDRDEDFGIEEMLVEDSSLLVGKSLQESKIRERYGVTVMAVKKKQGIINHNPEPGTIVESGDLLIVFGSSAQLSHFEQRAADR